MKTITVLTPTYNRSKNLIDLYNSLSIQSCDDFEWLIIDDGSTDDTNAIVESFIKEASFTITYKKKANGGKHTALNYAYQFINSPLTFIVDSDDKLTPNSIEVVCNTYDKNKDNKKLCGFSFLRGTSTGIQSKSGVPVSGMIENYIDCRINRGIDGDMAEVWYTSCLKEFPFVEFEGEKFLGEDYVWAKMSKKYDVMYSNDIIYIAEYLEEGLTKNRRMHNIQSPKGCVERANAFLETHAKTKVQIKSMLQYQTYGRFAKYSMNELFSRTNRKGLFCLLYLPATALYLNWKRKYTN